MQRKGNSDMQLRKIEPDDRFPCFACYDHPKEKLNCNQCKGNGWLPGSHPMVQFAEDFIEQKLSSMGFEDLPQPTNKVHFQPQPHMSSSQGPKRQQKQVNFTSSTKTVPGNQLRQSVKKDNSEELPHPFSCDECISQGPIKGLRYHCKECDDYDLCEACFLSGVHTWHQFQEVVPPKRKDNQTLVAENKKLTLLRKSVKM